MMQECVSTGTPLGSNRTRLDDNGIMNRCMSLKEDTRMEHDQSIDLLYTIHVLNYSDDMRKYCPNRNHQQGPTSHIDPFVKSASSYTIPIATTHPTSYTGQCPVHPPAFSLVRCHLSNVLSYAQQLDKHIATPHNCSFEKYSRVERKKQTRVFNRQWKCFISLWHVCTNTSYLTSWGHYSSPTSSLNLGIRIAKFYV